MSGGRGFESDGDGGGAKAKVSAEASSIGARFGLGLAHRRRAEWGASQLASEQWVVHTDWMRRIGGEEEKRIRMSDGLVALCVVFT